MVLIYISGGKDRARTHVNGQSFNKKDVAALVRGKGVTVAASASTKLDFVVLPPGVRQASNTTLLRTKGEVQVISWATFVNDVLKGGKTALSKTIAVKAKAKAKKVKKVTKKPRLLGGGSVAKPKPAPAVRRSDLLRGPQ